MDSANKMHLDLPCLSTCTIAVIGLGYVGLPLAVEFSKHKPCVRTKTLLRHHVIGFDVNTQRIDELQKGFDRTNEVTSEEIWTASSLEFVSSPDSLISADVFIITVPTPIDNAKRPDLAPLVSASKSVGQILKQRSKLSRSSPIIIYESTVFPGATEEVCIPILESSSGLILNTDFFVGYSPERINPGDKDHRLHSIIKVTSGSDADSATWIDNFYGSIIDAGTHLASSLKVAEAAKVIENTQRDLNIALINELAIIFRKMNIDTLDVLEASGTKWNFLPFKPGLVGGHCIGVDPYYLTHKAEQLGYHPQVVLAGRRINDGMGRWIAEQLILKMAQSKVPIGGSTVLILGITFKENCPDLRNTKIVDILIALADFGISSIVVDPWANPLEAQKAYGLKVYTEIQSSFTYQAVIAAVAHEEFKNYTPSKWQDIGKDAIVLDLKGIVPRELEPERI